ncbi:MAG: hypothetical protein KKB59_18350 [Spirochaetes bacterium]|nr:hypothetical protein [Spirochaetota bacterium]
MSPAPLVALAPTIAAVVAIIAELVEAALAQGEELNEASIIADAKTRSVARGTTVEAIVKAVMAELAPVKVDP